MRWDRQPSIHTFQLLSILSTVFLPVRLPDETDAKNILTASPLENRRRPPGRPRTMWMNTILQDLKSNNLSLNEAIDVAQNHPLWRLLCTPSGACHKWMRIYTLETCTGTEITPIPSPHPSPQTLFPSPPITINFHFHPRPSPSILIPSPSQNLKTTGNRSNINSDAVKEISINSNMDCIPSVYCVHTVYLCNALLTASVSY